MRGVQSRHAPGLVVMLTGELARYADTLSDLEALNVPLQSGLTWFRGVLISDGLNKSLQALYERPGLEWAWIMGDDHRFDPNIIINLLERDVDCIVPACMHRQPPFYSTVVRYVAGQKQFKLMTELPVSGTYKLGDGECCGDAGLLIRKRVLDAIPQPWFDTRRSGAFASDDLAFTSRIREAGFDIYVDCDNPIGHITPMTVTPKVRDGKWTLDIAAGDNPVGNFGPVWG